MKRIPLLALAIFLCIATNSFSQNSNIDFGIKAGANYSKYTQASENGFEYVQYQRKPGVYVGGFLNRQISDKLQFQPELLFALQGTNILIEDIELQGGFETTPILVDFESRINEFTIVVPLVLRYFFTSAFFMDAGPQAGYIINRNDKITKASFELPGEREEMNLDYDKLDLGITLGGGHNLSKSLTLNGRFFFSLIDRDNNLRSSVLNLGLEYKFL